MPGNGGASALRGACMLAIRHCASGELARFIEREAWPARMQLLRIAIAEAAQKIGLHRGAVKKS
ncbi:hypothetical protein PTKU64_49790 [Paraburkholderia terrae]|uniref:DUF982 domain-containing protein n=1 Tax=Paraburkholderia terrae TaxID=311230 RepID=A0ABN6JK94_9BURK|nr:hypothetical protein PTKU64_49790 [Paraburkholderia terrae]